MQSLQGRLDHSRDAVLEGDPAAVQSRWPFISSVVSSHYAHFMLSGLFADCPSSFGRLSEDNPDVIVVGGLVLQVLVEACRELDSFLSS